MHTRAKMHKIRFVDILKLDGITDITYHETSLKTGFLQCILFLGLLQICMLDKVDY